jgi:hypothetical protein
LALLPADVFSYGNVALAGSRKSVLSRSKHAVSRIETIGHNSLAKASSTTPVMLVESRFVTLTQFRRPVSSPLRGEAQFPKRHSPW